MATSWSTFPRTDKHPREWIRPGDDVSASDFDEQEEYDEAVAVGAIRDADYPIPQDDDGNYVFLGSPREYALEQLAAMQEGADELVAEVVMSTKVTPAQQMQAAEAASASDSESKSAPKAAAGNAKDK